MEQRGRALAACAGIAAIFLLVQVGALALVEPLQAGGNQFVENTGDPTNSLVYVGMILVATAVMLAVIRLGVEGLLRAFVVGSGVYIAFYVFQVVVPPLVVVPVAGVALNALAVGGALALGVALYVYPEWYVIDAAGVVMGVGAAGLFGINFGILPALVLLVVLAVYDAISVYGTEHMLTLASGVMDLRIPIVLVVPLSLSYSFLEADLPDPTEEGESEPATDGGSAAEPDGGEAGEEENAAEADEAVERDALFIGLGDAVIPTVLVASAGFFLEAPALPAPGLALNLPAATAMLGTLAGLAVLLRMVLAGRAHAGLPLLNGGTIAGYLVGALASGIPLAEALGLTAVL
jgi:presenilin-like A22 family membrane protease